MLPLLDVDAHVFNDDPVIWYAAVWAHSVIYGAMKSPDKPSRKMLDRLLELWLANIDKTPHGLITPFGLADGPVLPRPHWTPRLSADQRRQVRDLMNRPPLTTRPDSMAAALVAFHARSVCSDREIGKGVLPWATQGRQPAVDALLKQLRHAQPRPKS